jgi:PAS domain S-box-containing protein
MKDVNKKLILLVEDEVLIALAKKTELEKYGYRIITITSGEKAVIESQKNKNIELILMDIDLGPGIDGTEAAAIILKDREIPVVFMSSHTEPEIVEKTEKITSYGYVVKSSSITALDASIKMAFKLFEANNNNLSQKMEIETLYVQMKASNRELETTNKQLIESENKLIISETSIRKKLKAILDTKGDIRTLGLSDIIDTVSLQSMLENFYQLSGIPTAIVDLFGNILVKVGWQDICTKFHRNHPDTLKNCIESDLQLSKGVKIGEYKSYNCKNNLWDMVTPIEVGNIHMGNIYIGQFFYNDNIPDIDLFRKKALQYGFDEQEYLKAYNSVPQWNRSKVNTAMDFISQLTKIISNFSYSTIQLSRTLTEQKRIADIYRESDEKFKAFTNQAIEGITVADMKGNYTFVNPAFCRMSGYSEQELLDMTVFDMKAKNQPHKSFYDNKEKMEGIPIHVYLQRKDKSEYLTEIIGNVIKIGKNDLVLGIIRDITETKKAKESQRKASKK